MLRKTGKSINFRKLHRNLAWKKEIAENQHALANIMQNKNRESLIQCPICGNGDSSTFVIIYGFTYRECSSCGHLFASDPPTESEISRLYESEDELENIQHKVYVDEDIFLTRVAEIAVPKVAFVEEISGAGGQWVDIGCGTGEIVKAANKAGFDATGYDLDPHSIAFGKKKGLDLHCKLIDSTNAELFLKDAQVLSMLNILEHLPNPVQTLKVLTDALSTGSFFVAEVPRHPSFSSLSNLLFPSLSGRHIYPPNHLHVFTENSISHLLNLSGLELVGKWTFGQDFEELLSTAAINAGLMENSFVNQLLDKAAPIQQTIDELELSDVLLIVAVKI